MKNDKEQVMSSERKDLNLENDWNCKDDHMVFQRLNEIDKLLSHDEISQPENSIDKSIIAAAHRESIRPHIGRSYQISWWRKLSLPVYISAGFVFTVLAFKSLWPVPLKLIPSVESSTIAVDISLKVDHAGSKLPANLAEMTSSGLRSEIVLPQFTQVPAKPGKITNAQSNLQSEPIQPNSNLMGDSENDALQKVFTGNRLVKAKYPEKESWVRKIIEQMRDGRFEQANSELRDFKQIYPNYPIEEQIKVLIQ